MSFNSLCNIMEIMRTNSQNPEFKKIVQLLNFDLAERDGKTNALSQFNDISNLNYVVLALKKDKTIGCEAISEHNFNSMEIKRIYVSPEVRGQRVGEKILSELEN